MASKMYRGDSTWSSDQILTFENGKVYRGDSTWSSDQIATTDGGDASGGAAAVFLLLM